MKLDEYPFIGISGIIGCGKSTLTGVLVLLLASKLGIPFKAYYEHVKDNPYLGPFYEAISAYYEMKAGKHDINHGVQTNKADRDYIDLYKDFIKYKAHLESFGMETYLLNERYIDHKSIQWNLHKNGAIQDRTIFEDSIFVNMLHEDGIIRTIDKDANLKAYRIKAKHFQTPDVIIYLDVEPETAMKRVKNRGRDEETGITIDYLARLKKEYDKWKDKSSKKLNIQVIDWNEDNKDPEFIIDIIKEHCHI